MSEDAIRGTSRNWTVAARIALAMMVATALLVLLVAPPRGTTGATTRDSGPPYAVTSPNSSPARVFAHYFPPFPISLDNRSPQVDYYAKQYLSPNGEDGAHRAYGGLLRDRPVGRAPESGDWRLHDLETEVRQAAGAGIDGFTVDVLSYSGQDWDQTLRLEEAAARVHDGFVVVPNLDMTTSSGKADVATTAAHLAQLFRSSAVYRLSDGRYVLSSFEAEARPPGWWKQLESTMADRYGIRIALISVLLNASEQNLRDYAGVSYMLSAWGARDVGSLAGQSGQAATAHSLGVKWMAPVAVQDERPDAGLYAESDNTELLRASWQQAIDTGADAVQLVTWNDYSEGTAFAPSVGHGSVFLDIATYYIDWFKTGTAPAIDGDALYVTYRTQFANAVPTGGQTITMAPTLAGSSTPPRNDVEVLTFLSRPGEVTVSVGGHATSYRAPAGMSARLVPLRLGTVTAEMVRGGQRVLRVVAPSTVVARSTVQDLSYHAVGASTRALH